uniref:Transmembrane protein 272 n=1 Tax=Rousettus aegyptiacus TaxID=9407 RepID=A0A7J8E0H5_ROUAE|nr:transmembrane protein 272 [Rousettus aegyptiacus]
MPGGLEKAHHRYLSNIASNDFQATLKTFSELSWTIGPALTIGRPISHDFSFKFTLTEISTAPPSPAQCPEQISSQEGLAEASSALLTRKTRVNHLLHNHLGSCFETDSQTVGA